jgi:hypothetical protein
MLWKETAVYKKVPYVLNLCLAVIVLTYSSLAVLLASNPQHARLEILICLCQ